MNFHAFEREARRAFDGIPREYREGIDGLTVHRKALPHPRFRDIYTLGECVTEAWPSSWEGPETVRSTVLLYWGSFRALAELDPGFDWHAQMWDTLTHELRHHLESLADTDDLGGVDYAMEQTFRRFDGLDFDPEYYRHGDRIGPGVYAVEDDAYIEQRWKTADFRKAERLAFAWAGRSYEIARPETLGDLHFVRIVDGIGAPPYLEIVLVRRASWMERARAALRRTGLTIYESDAVARETGESE